MANVPGVVDVSIGFPLGTSGYCCPVKATCIWRKLYQSIMLDVSCTLHNLKHCTNWKLQYSNDLVLTMVCEGIVQGVERF